MQPMIPRKRFDIFPPDWGMLRRSRCVHIFLQTFCSTLTPDAGPNMCHPLYNNSGKEKFRSMGPYRISSCSLGSTVAARVKIPFVRTKRVKSLPTPGRHHDIQLTCYQTLLVHTLFSNTMFVVLSAHMGKRKKRQRCLNTPHIPENMARPRRRKTCVPCY